MFKILAMGQNIVLLLCATFFAVLLAEGAVRLFIDVPREPKDLRAMRDP